MSWLDDAISVLLVALIMAGLIWVGYHFGYMDRARLDNVVLRGL